MEESMDGVTKAVVIVGSILIICITVGSLQQCSYDNAAMLKCIEKTGDKYCGARSIPSQGR